MMIRLLALLGMLMSPSAFAVEAWISDVDLKAYFATIGVKIYSTEACPRMTLPNSKLLKACAKMNDKVRFSCVDKIKNEALTKESKEWKLVVDPRFQDPNNQRGVWHNNCGEAKRLGDLKAKAIKAVEDAKDDVHFNGLLFKKANQGNRTASEIQKISGDKSIKEVASFCINSRYMLEKCKALKPEDRVACIAHPDKRQLPAANWKMLTNPELLSVTTALEPQAYFTLSCSDVSEMPH